MLHDEIRRFLENLTKLNPAQSEDAQTKIRNLARQLGLNKYTVWRRRMLVFSIIGIGGATRFSGVVEADETYKWESRK